jgi:hypothetical protein
LSLLLLLTLCLGSGRSTSLLLCVLCIEEIADFVPQHDEFLVLGQLSL